MRERAVLFGGELAAAPFAGGFRVQASLRITDPHARDLPASDLPASDLPASDLPASDLQASGAGR
jgi:hypothetical protein